MKRLLLAALLACVLLGGTLLPATGGNALPDLIVDRGYLVETVHVSGARFGGNSCVVDEGYLPDDEPHALLKFTTVIANIGGPFRLGKPNAADPRWDWGECHQHWHFKGYATYELQDLNGVQVSASNKMGFCVMDSFRYLDVNGGGHFTCKNQGMSHGWADVYVYQLMGQWVVIDDVPPGDYNLTVTVNPDRAIEESDYSNNSATIPVTIP